MNNRKFDVVIPVGNKDADFVHKVASFISRCLPDVNTIYILTSGRLENRIKASLRGQSTSYVIVNENELIPGLTYEAVKRCLSHVSPALTSKTGWYFQQFLKLGFSRSGYSSEYYLSWDADTLPLAQLHFFEDDHILYNPKTEYHQAYFTTLHNLLGIEKAVNHSFISEHMLFVSSIVRELLNDVEHSPFRGDNWFEKILMACDYKESELAFSEFETYGNYCCAKYPGLYKARYLNTFREAGMIRGRHISETQLRKLSFDIDIASFEMSDSPMFPYNIPNLFFAIKTKCRKARSYSIADLFRRVLRKFNRGQMTGKNMSQDVLFRLPPKKVINQNNSL